MKMKCSESKKCERADCLHRKKHEKGEGCHKPCFMNGEFTDARCRPVQEVAQKTQRNKTKKISVAKRSHNNRMAEITLCVECKHLNLFTGKCKYCRVTSPC